MTAPVYLPANLRPQDGRSLEEIGNAWLWGDFTGLDSCTSWPWFLSGCPECNGSGRSDPATPGCATCGGSGTETIVPLWLPSGRDLAARALAEWCGLEIGETAPTWTGSALRVPPPSRGLSAGVPRLQLTERRFVGRLPPSWRGQVYLSGERPLYIEIPGLSHETPPAEALRLACLHVCGEGGR